MAATSELALREAGICSLVAKHAGPCNGKQRFIAEGFFCHNWPYDPYPNVRLESSRAEHVDKAVGHVKDAVEKVRGVIETAKGDTAPATDKPTSQKMDVGKVPMFQGFLRYFFRASYAVALVSEYGKRKYTPDAAEFNSGWRDVLNGPARYGDAALRHMTKALAGSYDEGSDIAHLAHAAWNILAVLEIMLEKKELELRVGNVIVNGKPVLHTSKKVEL